MLSATLVKQEAQALGFNAAGLAPAEAVEPWRQAQWQAWLGDRRQGEMDYLERNLEKRLNPTLLVDGAKTIVSVALGYFPAVSLSPEGYTMARYAYGQDYHDVVRHRLEELMQRLGLEPHKDGRAFCDTAPIDERYWAWRCGLGWMGRHTQLIIPPQHGRKECGGGTYFFLGELVLKHRADHYDQPIDSHCGTCQRCLEACPTDALSDRGLDARKCLSYLTIEHRGPLDESLAAHVTPCIYGCDRCAEACPWNKFAKPTTVTEFSPSKALMDMTKADWHSLSVEQYQHLFKGSAVKRAKFEGLKRNIEAAKNHSS